MIDQPPGSPGRRFPGVGLDQVPISVREAGPFVAGPLPAEPHLHLSTYRLAAGAEGSLNRADEVANRLPSRDWLTHLTRLCEVQAAAGLNGIYRPLRKLLMWDLPGRIGQAVDKRLLPYLRADLSATAEVAAGKPIDIQLFGKISAILSGLPDDGQLHWRPDQTWCGPSPENAVTLTAAPGSELEDRTRELCEWVQANDDLPPVVLVAIVHHRLAVLAPFPGSDHLARLYIILQLIKDGVIQDQILPIAPWIFHHGDGYWARFRDCLNGDLDSWVAFIARRIRDACLGQIFLINELDAVRSIMRAPFIRRDHFLEAIGNLSGYPVLNGHQLAKLQDVNTDHAGELINRLIGANLVKRMDPKTGLWIEDDDTPRYGTVVGSPAILEILERYLPMPEEGEADPMS